MAKKIDLTSLLLQIVKPLAPLVIRCRTSCNEGPGPSWLQGTIKAMHCMSGVEMMGCCVVWDFLGFELTRMVSSPAALRVQGIFPGVLCHTTIVSAAEWYADSSYTSIFTQRAYIAVVNVNSHKRSSHATQILNSSLTPCHGLKLALRAFRGASTNDFDDAASRVINFPIPNNSQHCHLKNLTQTSCNETAASSVLWCAKISALRSLR